MRSRMRMERKFLALCLVSTVLALYIFFSAIPEVPETLSMSTQRHLQNSRRQKNLVFVVWFDGADEIQSMQPGLVAMGYNVTCVGSVEVVRAHKTEKERVDAMVHKFRDADVVLFWNWGDLSPSMMRQIKAAQSDTQVWALYNFDDPHVWFEGGRTADIQAKAPLFDYVFTTGSIAVPKYLKHGAGHAEFIMPAWSPKFHYFDPDPEIVGDCDVNFVLTNLYDDLKYTTISRRGLLDALLADANRTGLKVRVYGYAGIKSQKERYAAIFKGSVQWSVSRRVYSSCIVSLNTLANDGRGGLYTNSRTPYIMASGGIMLVDSSPAMKGLVKDGVDAIVMRSTDPVEVVKQIHEIVADKTLQMNVRAHALSSAVKWESYRWARQIHLRLQQGPVRRTG